MDIKKKVKKEQEIVDYMINLYCKNKHQDEYKKKNELCESCETLLLYSHERSSKCPVMKEKTFCSNCRIHCYKPEMRERIRGVMKYSGPRLLLHNPMVAINHVIASKKEKRKLLSKR